MAAEEHLKRIPSKGWPEMIRKVYEVDPMVCPKCGGRMKIIAFITEYAAVDRIIDHVKMTFVAEKPPPSHVVEQVALMAAEESGDIFDHLIFTGRESLSSFSQCGRISCPDMIFGRDFRGY